jgi:hypothetical protein
MYSVWEQVDPIGDDGAAVAGAAQEEETVINVTVRTVTGRTAALQLAAATATVQSVKDAVERQWEIPVQEQRLLHANEELGPPARSALPNDLSMQARHACRLACLCTDCAGLHFTGDFNLHRRTLEQCGVGDGAILHLVLKLASPAAESVSAKEAGGQTARV